MRFFIKFVVAHARKDHRKKIALSFHSEMVQRDVLAIYEIGVRVS